MSGIAKATTKAFKKLVSNKGLQLIAVAAAVYFTAGAASGYFAAPAAEGAAVTAGAQGATGAGGALGAAGAAPSYTQATTAIAQQASAAGATQAAGTAQSMAAAGGVEVGSIAASPPVVGTPLPAPAAGATGATGATNAASAASAVPGAAVTPGAEAALTEASISGTMPASATGNAVTAGSTVNTALPPVKTGIIESVGGWMKANPMATMMLGQGVMSSYDAHLQDEADRREDEWRRSRGAMGYDFHGNSHHQPGIVASQAATAPATQQSQAQAEQRTRPVERKNLAALHSQGLVNNTRKA